MLKELINLSMMTSILPHISNFHAIGYKEQESSEDVASLFEILNSGSIVKYAVQERKSMAFKDAIITTTIFENLSSNQQ